MLKLVPTILYIAGYLFIVLYLSLHSMSFSEFVVLKGKSLSFLLSNYTNYFDLNVTPILWAIVFSSFMVLRSLRKDSPDLRSSMFYCGSYWFRSLISIRLCECINPFKVYLLQLGPEGPIYPIRRQIMRIEVQNLVLLDMNGNKLKFALDVPDNKLTILWLFRFLWDLISLVIYFIFRHHYMKDNKETKEDTGRVQRRSMRKRMMVFTDTYFMICFLGGILRAANLHRSFIFF